MTIFTIPYGKRNIKFTLEGKHIDLILPNSKPGAEHPLQISRDAINTPLGAVDYSQWRAAQSVAIAINDKTRPVPLEYLLPPLLDKLKELEIPHSAVTFLIATGTHKPLTQTETALLVPQLVDAGYRVISHDCDDRTNLTYLGETIRGTPIWINQIFLEADVRIVVGDIEPHHFMGFSGGAKGAAIGLAGRETINANHSMLIDPRADIGIYHQNPMRQDLEEIGDKINIHLVVNAVLNQSKEIVAVFAGKPREVVLAGMPVSLEVCVTQVKDRYDLVIASAGGYPKDINLYQAQKAVSHAAQFARKGGVIIVAAECIEGSGSEGFEAFVAGIHSFSEVEEKFKRMGFQVGPHKAFQLARQAANYSIYLFSAIPHGKVQQFLLNPVDEIENIVASCLKGMPENPRIAVIPYATNTLPHYRKY